MPKPPAPAGALPAPADARPGSLPVTCTASMPKPLNPLGHDSAHCPIVAGIAAALQKTLPRAEQGPTLDELTVDQLIWW